MIPTLTGNFWSILLSGQHFAADNGFYLWSAVLTKSYFDSPDIGNHTVLKFLVEFITMSTCVLLIEPVVLARLGHYSEQCCLFSLIAGTPAIYV